MTNYTYNYTEEAFLLSSLHEMVKVWASGSGKARFNLDICDGSADLQLNFQLGHPSEAHCDQYPPPNHEPPQQEVYQPPPEAFHPVRRRRRKGPARRAHDRERAEEHQARKFAAAPAVILPFAGRLLPVKTPKVSQQKLVPHEEKNSAASAVNPSVTVAAAAAVTPPAVRLPSAVRPGKPSSTPNQSQQRNVEVNIVKKQLFAPPQAAKPPSVQLSTYKMKEEDHSLIFYSSFSTSFIMTFQSR